MRSFVYLIALFGVFLVASVAAQEGSTAVEPVYVCENIASLENDVFSFSSTCADSLEEGSTCTGICSTFESGGLNVFRAECLENVGLVTFVDADGVSGTDYFEVSSDAVQNYCLRDVENDSSTGADSSSLDSVDSSSSDYVAPAAEVTSIEFNLELTADDLEASDGLEDILITIVEDFIVATFGVDFDGAQGILYVINIYAYYPDGWSASSSSLQSYVPPGALMVEIVFIGEGAELTDGTVLTEESILTTFVAAWDDEENLLRKSELVADGVFSEARAAECEDGTFAVNGVCAEPEPDVIVGDNPESTSEESSAAWAGILVVMGVILVVIVLYAFYQHQNRAEKFDNVEIEDTEYVMASPSGGMGAVEDDDFVGADPHGFGNDEHVHVTIG